MEISERRTDVQSQINRLRKKPEAEEIPGLRNVYDQLSSCTIGHDSIVGLQNVLELIYRVDNRSNFPCVKDECTEPEG